MVIVSDRALWFFGLFLGGSENVRALAFWPFIFVSSKTTIDPVLINHERIHLRQQIEMLLIPFYIMYLIEFYAKGYYNVSFEREAYQNENNLLYLKKRRFFHFIKYI